MNIQSDFSGLTMLQERLDMAISELPSLLLGVAQKAGSETVAALRDASPRGKSGGGPPMDGDASGPLSDSFYSVTEEQGNAVVVDIGTTQPSKLNIIREGRGEVRPKVKKALYWKGLPHPVMRSGPTKPNEYVTPILDNTDSRGGEELQGIIDTITGILET